MSDDDSLVETVCGKGIGDHLELLIERLRDDMRTEDKRGKFVLLDSKGRLYAEKKPSCGCPCLHTAMYTGECSMPYRADVYSTEKAALKELTNRMILDCESYEVRKITPGLLEELRGWEVPGWWRPKSE